MNDEDFLRLMSQYRFTLAFENAIGDDYITEKLWRALIVGSVPVYLGSPSIQVCQKTLPLDNFSIETGPFLRRTGLRIKAPSFPCWILTRRNRLPPIYLP